jgi:protein-tyrosine phosphatase
VTEGIATENHTKRILFVCTANICRSPMAAAMFNALAEERELAYRAESAGVAALTDEDIAPNARVALDEVGIYAEDHRARQVSDEMLDEADLVLAMGTAARGAALRRLVGGLRGKVCTLPQYALAASGEEGIPDPYGHTMTAYRASVRQILGCVEGLMERLEREGALR